MQKNDKMRFSRRANRTMRIRIVWLMAAFGISAFLPLLYRLYQIQSIDTEIYLQAIIENLTRETVVSPVRGAIYDCNYELLAVSANSETVFISPASIKDNTQALVIARGLSDILNVDYSDLYNKTQKAGRYYEIVKREVEKEQGDRIRAFISENRLQQTVYIIPDIKRYYPNDNFLSHVLGFVGVDNYGLYGIENVYENELKGVPGLIIANEDASGKIMSFQYEESFDAEDGHNIVLTIDATIQSFVEKHLKVAITEYQVKQGAAAIVMDVHTGAILAMDTQISFNPNQPWELVGEPARTGFEGLADEERTVAVQNALYTQWRNKAVTDTYEPGSAFGIITSAIALEEKVVRSNDRFYCSGSVALPGWDEPIRCHEQNGHGIETFAQGARNSCNIVFSSVAQQVGAEKYYDYFKAFGFTEKTGIDTTGESAGICDSWEDFNNILTLSNYSFGLTFGVTPIQFITAVSAVANGGYLMRPHLVREFTDSENNIVKTVKPEVVQRVISTETSRQVCEMMETAVGEGTGNTAYVEGYRIAGKDGAFLTRAPQNTDEYIPGKYIASFIAVAPADDPQIALLVLLDGPMAESSEQPNSVNMAATLAGHIMSDILPYLQIGSEGD